jgi:integrase/recombinase XerC
MTPSLDEFAAHLRAQDANPHTVNAYCGDVAAFFAWLAQQIGHAVPPVEVTAFDVQRYRDHLVAQGRKPAGVNRRLASLRAFFAWTVQSGQAASNPAGDVKGLRQARRTPKALDTQEVYRLQRTAAAQRQVAEAKAGKGNVTPTVVTARRDEALLTLLLYTGLRVGEAAALTVADVTLNERSGKVVVRSGKGRKYREIPLHKEVRRVLADYLEVRSNDDQGDPDGRPLFLGQRGALGTRGIQMQLAALGEAAGVAVTPHVLRHTFATRLLREAGADLVTVAALLGHESVATTALYTQPGEADLVKAVEELG